MYLKLKKPESVISVADMKNGQLYLDIDGDVNLIVRDEDDEIRSVCFHGGEVIIMDNPPTIQRLVSFEELGVSDE